MWLCTTCGAKQIPDEFVGMKICCQPCERSMGKEHGVECAKRFPIVRNDDGYFIANQALWCRAELKGSWCVCHRVQGHTGPHDNPEYRGPNAG